MRNKIKIIEDDIDDTLRTIAVAAHISLAEYEGKISEEEAKEKIISQLSDRYKNIFTMGEVRTDAERIAYSFGNEFYSPYNRLGEIGTEYVTLVITTHSVWDDRKMEKELHFECISLAAKLHTFLEEKLLSIRA